ncbi:hypothetical protein BXT92_09970 [Klebsiella pneumoniae]|nr:hypothetical protein BXT92_09970 [Klebsiella pneumoniae]
MKYKKFAMGLLLLAGSQLAQAEQIGSVDTVFKWLGPDHKIVVEAFDDPDVQNVTCYISRAKLTDKIKNGKSQGDVVFQKRTSLVFKKLQVVRFYDAKRNALVYLTYSDKVVDGSPKNAISAVPIMPWNK